MENASKALLIAAAVLVVIMVISLGIVIYRMGSEAVGEVNFTGQQVAANNEKFIRYNGNGKRGTEVNAMLQTVLNANVEATSLEGDNSPRGVTVKLKPKSGSETTLLSPTDKSIPALSASQIQTSRLYNITVSYGGQGGLVDSILVEER